MNQGIPRPRLLPATIVVMALLLAVKSVGLVQAAAATGAAEGSAAGGGLSTGSVGAAGMAAGGASPGATPVVVPSAGAPPAPAAAAGVVTAAAPTNTIAGTPAVSDAERGLLLDLRHRRETLEGRSRALDQRQAVMSAAEQKLSARVAELTALQGKLDTLETARKSHDTANWASLVKVYEAMKPRDAATIFDALDMQVLLGVLDRMSERKAAPVLAAMQPDRARLATQLLAEMRTRAVTPAGEPPQLANQGMAPGAAK